MHDESDKQKRDAELVFRALKNQNDFVDIVRQYQTPIRRYVVRLGCRDDHDADDILQDIFIKVYINLNDYDTDLKFSSWLYRIAHNETISFFRKKNVRPAPVTTNEELKLFENLADEGNFISSLDTQLHGDMVHDALAEMTGHSRDVLVLRFFEEKSYTEISDILKIPEGTVGTLLNRGKKRLREILTAKNIDV
ncbi:MAG: RNA polymerase sigma factor [Minisyncoccota bacterium]